MALFDIADALPYTLLSLPRFARIMGINPVHFQGGVGENVFPIGSNACNDVWPRMSWQAGDRVSHEDLAYAIEEAEQDIARVLRHYPAPVWISQEAHKYPKFYRTDLQRLNGVDASGSGVGLQTNWGKVISPGRRAVSLIGTATVAGGTLVYSDEDGDGFTETATIVLPTTQTDACELKVYYTGSGGAQEWEIRPERSKEISGGNVTFVFQSWLFINPDLQAEYPTTEGFTAIDLTTTANYVTSVQVYREYTDTTATSARFFWEPEHRGIQAFCTVCSGAGCPVCSLTYQDGCFHIRDAETGVVVPTTATYDATDGQWEGDNYTVCRDPDEVTLWYYAGSLDEYNLRGSSCRMLSNRLARAIAWLATARLERPLCSCNVVTALSTKLMRDLALAGAESYMLNENALDNPFGTRYGEVYAWRYVQNIAEHSMGGVAV